MAVSSSPRIGVIGAGKMGEALIAGWLQGADGSAPLVRPSSLCAVNRRRERSEYLSERFGISCTEDVARMDPVDVLIVAVKPQVLPSVVAEVRGAFAQEPADARPLVVSIAAGVSLRAIESGLWPEARVVRAMPNMPLAVAKGATGMCAGRFCSGSDVELASSLFDSLGYAAVVGEDLMDTVCAVSGSGPAYVALFVEALAEAACDRGMPKDLALNLAVHTVRGTASYLLETGISPDEARRSICSPNGTTLAALDALEETKFVEAVKAAVEAAARRSQELGKTS